MIYVNDIAHANNRAAAGHARHNYSVVPAPARIPLRLGKHASASILRGRWPFNRRRVRL